jgi:hypothetical protein
MSRGNDERIWIGGLPWRTLQRAAVGFSPRNGALKYAAAR